MNHPDTVIEIRKPVEFTIDGRTYQTLVRWQPAGDLLLLAGLNPDQYHLGELGKTDQRTKIRQAIATQIGARATVVNSDLCIDGERTWDLEIHEDRDRSYGYARGTTGKMSVVVGNYGNKSRYPERKNGGHNYPAIAEKLVHLHDARIKRDQITKKVENNRITHVDALRTEFGYVGGWSINATSDESKPVRVERKVALTGTPDQVRLFKAAIDEVVARFAEGGRK